MSTELIEPDYNNDFNYPSLSRKDLMYLDSIRSRDFPIRKINQINSNRDWSANLYNLDIEKSAPYRSNIYTNKIDFINKIDDIEFARPKKERIFNKPNFILNVRDIEKAYPNKPNPVSQRHVNPLNPVYKLPSFKMPPPPTPPKFIRDSMDVSDIEKAKPNKLFPLKMRPVKTYDEIGGNHPRKPYERKIFYDSLNYNDVSKKKKKFRNTNPLDPEYDKPYGGYIEGSKPGLPFYDFNADNSKNALSNEDIYGSVPGSKNYYANFRYDNKERYETNDILGASANTRKIGITTNRCTNPLQPNYQYIGNSEVIDCFGEVITHNKNNNNNNKKIIRTFSNPQIASYNNYENVHNNNFNYNNTNNLYYSQDYHNIMRTDRNNRKMSKSLSCVEIERKMPILNSDINTNNNNNENSKENGDIDIDLPEYNDKPKFNPALYKKPIPNFENNHDSDLLLGRSNKNNRLDVKLQKFGKFQNFKINNRYKNENNFNRNFSNLKNQRGYETDITKNGYDTLYQKLNSFENNNTYENQLQTLINRQNI